MVIRVTKKGQFKLVIRVVKKGQFRVVIRVTKMGQFKLVIRVVKKGQISICNRMRPSRIKDKFPRVFSNFSQVKFILNSTRTQCDYLFITQRAKFSENFPCTLKHNQPALRIIIRVPARKQFTKQFNCCSAHKPRKTDHYVHLKR